ncbi:ferritin-like protein [Sphingomonas cannabina]|uniref:ferritin-like domain-containing protein n=1 Tax=Sphingomonas cannabina TaxID=2899123 RepID=UPI001F17C0BA|nr:ferritin-like protein [Sphingomonas cannabina]UIJ45521.1 ferritin-like protein [Sphingomonas cannabina]
MVIPKDSFPVTREALLHALYEAAELEQNLMCTYLYAAFSLKAGEAEGLSASEAEAVARWRHTILGVAVDEMSHLAAVWNLTSALGGAPRFGRTNFPLEAGYLPANIVVKLAPFSEDVIQHFIYLERPDTSDEPDGEGFAAPVTGPRTPAALRLTPTGFDYATIGDFYQRVESDLRALVAALGEKTVFCGDPALQLTEAENRLKGARAVTDLDSALAALTEIVVEGEGAPDHRENSHFARFLAVRSELRQLRAANPDFAPAHPAAVNPVLRKPPHPDGKVWLENAEAVATVDAANAIYALALRLLAGAYAVPRPDPRKATYVACAVGLMHAIGAMGERAARLPAGSSHPECKAGISFTAPREAASLPQGTSAHEIYTERLDQLLTAVEAMDPADPNCVRVAQILQSQADRLRAL